MSNLVETLYYQLNSSVLTGNVEDSKMYLAFLREEYERDCCQFEVLKKDYRWSHLELLGSAIDKGQIVKNFEKVESVHDRRVPIKQDSEFVFDSQDVLVREMNKSKDLLRECLRAKEDFYFCNLEYETKFGRVDIVAEDSDTVYPIEVKKGYASHEVIGQINKYIYHFKLWLINRTYEHVVGVVIANGFDEYILQELSSYGAIAIKYSVRNNKVEFARL